MNYPRSEKFLTPGLLQKIMGPNPVKLEEELLLHHRIPQGAVVCDLGSGQGLTSVFLAKEYGFTVYAADLWSDPAENRVFFRQMGLTDEQIIPVKADAEIELGSHNLLVSLARIGLGVACVTEEFSQSGLGRGVILPLKTDFTIPPRAVVMCTLRGVTPTSAANRFMDFISESNRMAYDPGHSYHFTNG